MAALSLAELSVLAGDAWQLQPQCWWAFGRERDSSRVCLVLVNVVSRIWDGTNGLKLLAFWAEAAACRCYNADSITRLKVGVVAAA